MAITYTPQGLSDAAKCFSCLRGAPADWVIAFSAASWAGISTSPQTLVNLVTPLDRLTGDEVDAVQAYLLAVIAGGTQDLNALSVDARCYSCLDGQEKSVQALLYSSLAVLGDDPQALLNLASPFQSIPKPFLDLITIYALATRAGVSTNYQSLADAAKCFRCLGSQVSRVILLLLSDIGGGVPPPFETPFLEFDSPGRLVWLWDFALPDKWRIEISSDGNEPWSEEVSIPATPFVWETEVSGFARVTGTNSLGDAITNPSNAVSTGV